MAMRILTASKGFIPRMRAHQFKFPGCEHHFIFDSDDQRENACETLGLQRELTHVANTPKDIGRCGAAYVRQWGEDHLIADNEWYVWLDDNVGEFTWLPLPWYRLGRIDFDFDWELEGHKCYDFRPMYNTPCPPEVIQHIWQETIDECKRMGTVFGGFAIETNYFFRKVKWQYFGYVRCQCSVQKKTGLPWYYWDGCMLEDFVRSVDVVTRYGCIVINRFMKPHKPFFEQGGIGTFEERRPMLVAVNEELMRRYPGLLSLNKGQDYQLTFAKRTALSIYRWRQEHGYIE